MSNIKVCGDCAGTGTHKSEYWTEVCKRCDGSGRVVVTVSLTEKPFVPGESKRLH